MAAKPKLNLDAPTFTIWCRIKDDRGRTTGFYIPERHSDDMTRAAVIRDIVTGQVEDVERVLVGNSAEHTCDDITADIARDIARSLDANEPISPELFDFIEAQDSALARGLKVYDRTMAA